MHLHLTFCLALVTGLTFASGASFSGPTTDSEGSGDELGGSGSGEWSEDYVSQEAAENTENESSKVVAENARKENHDTKKVKESWVDQNGDSEAGFVFLSNGVSLMHSKDIVAGLSAGIITGLALGACLSAVLIYKLKNKEKKGYVIDQKYI